MEADEVTYESTMRSCACAEQWETALERGFGFLVAGLITSGGGGGGGGGRGGRSDDDDDDDDDGQSLWLEVVSATYVPLVLCQCGLGLFLRTDVKV